jgi:predicted O-methyltransferase YrrM
MSKVEKFKKFFNSKGKIKTFVNQLVYEDKLIAILNKYKLHAFNQVDTETLFLLLGESSVPEINVKADFTGGISPVNDYYMLCRIAKAIKAEKYFEIGTWLGLSAYNIHINSKNTEVYTLDIPYDHEEIRLYGIPKDVFGFYSKKIETIHHLKADSKNFDCKPYSKTFDLVFIDGNHSLDYVKNDTKIALELIRNEKSIIAWHDYILSGEVNKNVLCGILDSIPAAEHKHIIHLYQSNLALFSKSFNFPERHFDQWEIPVYNYELTIKQKTKQQI